MGYRATLSCDQPDCTTSLDASITDIDFTLRYCGWKTEETEQGAFYTCPHHEPDTVPIAMRRLANAGRTLMTELHHLDDEGYYVVGIPSDSDGVLLQLHRYEDEEGDGPFVLVTQYAHSFGAKLMAGDDDGTVVFDEDHEVWDA